MLNMSNQQPSLFDALEKERKILTVTELSFQIKNQLEREFRDVWVSGEVGKVTDHASGIYFSLKEDQALVDAVIWRREVRRVLQFALETGAQVLVHGHLDLYVPRGQYKLIVDQIEPKGLGSLQKKLEQLKKKLKEEGLFEESRKRPLPFLPKRIGVVTALEGAAVRDIIATILHRYPKASIVVRPSRVQGDGAAAEIVRAMTDLQELPDVEVMIVGRGGGSLEDLWAFNEEIVARAIAGCKIPVISAVGHEVDYTIADFVADRRAKTPTDAGVIVIPSLEDLELSLSQYAQRLIQSLESELETRREKLKSLREHWVLRRPLDQLANYRGNLERELETLRRAFEDLQRERVDRCAAIAKKIAELRPHLQLEKQRNRIAHLFARFDRVIANKITASAHRFSVLGEKLEGRSPVAILSRGYSLTRSTRDSRFLTKVEDLKKGELIETILHRGKIISRVEEIG